MISWNMSFERELIKQRSLFDLPMSHHDSQSCFSQRLNQRNSSFATADFFNKIDPNRTSPRARVRRTKFQNVGPGLARYVGPTSRLTVLSLSP